MQSPTWWNFEPMLGRPSMQMPARPGGSTQGGGGTAPASISEAKAIAKPGRVAPPMPRSSTGTEATEELGEKTSPLPMEWSREPVKLMLPTLPLGNFVEALPMDSCKLIFWRPAEAKEELGENISPVPKEESYEPGKLTLTTMPPGQCVESPPQDSCKLIFWRPAEAKEELRGNISPVPKEESYEPGKLMLTTRPPGQCVEFPPQDSCKLIFWRPTEAKEELEEKTSPVPKEESNTPVKLMLPKRLPWH
mmetsp:Transcript_164485/g.527541  ORF Transcript_164485/g.527541 Transcript_164485/m.527541 type:complete len:249 (+) Transcript_164485:339-1085(+)